MSDEEIVLKRLKETLDVLKGKNVIGRIDFQIRDMVEDCIRIIEKQKEKNKELSSSYDKLAKECNEENRRCMLLAVENQDLKEKLRERCK